MAGEYDNYTPFFRSMPNDSMLIQPSRVEVSEVS